MSSYVITSSDTSFIILDSINLIISKALNMRIIISHIATRQYYSATVMCIIIKPSLINKIIAIIHFIYQVIEDQAKAIRINQTFYFYDTPLHHKIIIA